LKSFESEKFRLTYIIPVCLEFTQGANVHYALHDLVLTQAKINKCLRDPRKKVCRIITYIPASIECSGFPK
jgi:hypothetical protein